MVVGGLDDDTEPDYNDTQIIDLLKQKTCKWNDFPVASNGATGAIMPNNDTLICGGYSSSGTRH